MTILETALQYFKKDFSVIPVGFDKKPFIKWEPYQKKRASEEEIKKWFDKKNPPNIGIITGEISNLLLIDCDTSEAIQRIQDAIPDSLIVPCQKTPSGGMHFLFSHAEGFVNRARVAEGIDIRTTGGYFVAAPSINGTGKEWEWVISPLDAEPPYIINSITSLFSLYRESSFNITRQNSQMSSNVVMFNEGNRNDDLFHVANRLFLGHMKYEEILQVIEIFGKSCNPPWGSLPKDGPIDVIVKSAMKRAESRERNVTEEVREWILSSNGVFLSSELSKCLHLSSREEEKHLSKILSRLSEQRLIEKFGIKRGCYRVIESAIEYMDYKNVSKEGAIDLILPLDVHKKTIFFPRNVIVVAGVTGYGKTSYLLNVIKDNMDKFKFKYFASEMSELALNYKLSRFNIPVNHWKMDVIPDYAWDYMNIQDKIFPDDMNVIDYLEPEGEKTYYIHEIITKIIKKLNKGMALIATQKRQGADLSAGGVYSAKASSLYLSLDWGTIFIFKNRFREEDPHPKLTKMNFNIESGQAFTPTGGWYNPNEKKKSNSYESFIKDE